MNVRIEHLADGTAIHLPKSVKFGGAGLVVAIPVDGDNQVAGSTFGPYKGITALKSALSRRLKNDTVFLPRSFAAFLVSPLRR